MPNQVYILTEERPDLGPWTYEKKIFDVETNVMIESKIVKRKMKVRYIDTPVEGTEYFDRQYFHPDGYATQTKRLRKKVE